MQLLDQLRAQKLADKRAKFESDLMRQEAKIGGQLFGPIHPGGRRDFFCLDESTWIWHEEWTDQATGQHKVITTKYEIRQNGILKIQDNQMHSYTTPDETRNLLKAIHIYEQRVNEEVFSQAA